MELRQRLKHDGDDDDARAKKFMMDIASITHSTRGGSISVREVMAAVQGDVAAQGGEVKVGYLDKRVISLFDGLLPEICDCRKKWKLNRFLVAVGHYLYRFKDENSESLKGVPIPLTNATIKALKFRKGDTATNEIDEGYCIEVCTMRKRYVLRAKSTIEAEDWVKFLNNRKAQAMREKLGHAPVASALAKLNEKAKKMVEDRLAREVSDAEEIRQEMQTMLDKNMPGSMGMNPMRVSSSYERDM